MKIRRVVTQKMLDANRENAKKSTGPQTETGKEASSANSIKHGLLADRLVFESDEDEEQFGSFIDQLMDDLTPDGALESMIVEEISVCWWRLRSAIRWEMEGLRSRKENSRDVVQGLATENLSSESKLEFLDSKTAAVGSGGWECTELLVRKGRTNESSTSSKVSNRDIKAGEQVYIQLEAKLAKSLDTSMRYSAMIRKDLHRAIEQLKGLRAQERN